jgi:hypothetical protein
LSASYIYLWSPSFTSFPGYFKPEGAYAFYNPQANQIEFVDANEKVISTEPLPNEIFSSLFSITTFKFDSAVSVEEQSAIGMGVDIARQSFAKIGHVTVYASPDCRWLYSQYRLGGSPGNSECGILGDVSGLGPSGKIFINTSSTFQGNFSRLRFDAKLHTVIHEFYHDVQHYYAGSVGLMGPVWLVEGSAEYMTFRVLDQKGIRGFKDTRNRATSFNGWFYGPPLSNEPLKLFEYMSYPGSIPAYQLGFLATDMLVSEHGEDSLMKYWQTRRTASSWQSAFQEAFGESVDNFYIKFEAWRKAGFPQK